MNTTWTLAYKDIRLLIRDKATLFWVLVFPLLIGVLFGFVFGGTSEMSPIPIAVVDQDKSATSKALIDELKKSKSLKVEMQDLEQAKTAVRKGKKAAYIQIPKDYGAYDPFEKAPEAASIKIGADPSRRIESGMLEGMLQGAAFQAQFGSMNDPDGAWKQRVDKGINSPSTDQATKDFLRQIDKYMSSHSGKQDMQLDGPKIVKQDEKKEGSGPASSFEITFPQALVWGILGVVSTFAISLVKERQQGTLLRLTVSPMTFTKILAGKGLACFLSVEAVMLGLLLLGHFMFKVRLLDPIVLTMAMASTGVAFVGVMLLLSTLGKTEQAVSGSSWGVMILMAMFGGGMLPIAMMPGWMQRVSDLSPLKWSTLAIEGAIWRGFGVQEMFLPCGVLIGVGLVSVPGRYAYGSRSNRVIRDTEHLPE